jgi:hypothetical protein
VFEEKVLLKLKHKVLGIAGHTEHERTLSQSERAQKELVEFGLITCDANLFQGHTSQTDSLGSQVSAGSTKQEEAFRRCKMVCNETGNDTDTCC